MTEAPNPALPVAGYSVYLPEAQNEYFVHELDEAIDDLTNCVHETHALVRLSDATAALQAQAAAHAADRRDAWQPIETAPKDEAHPFLLLRRGIVVQVSRFEGRLYPDAREACVDWGDGIEDGTHWTPLPAALATPTGSKEVANDN